MSLKSKVSGLKSSKRPRAPKQNHRAAKKPLLRLAEYSGTGVPPVGSGHLAREGVATHWNHGRDARLGRQDARPTIPAASHHYSQGPPDSSPADLPFTFSNFAITADGKIAFANRQFVPFAGKRDQEHMMELRATADAVMSGARTVDLSSATLGPGGIKYRRQRIKRGLREYNLRIIVSGSGSIDPQAEIFRHKFSPIIVLTTKRATTASRHQLQKLGAEIKICGEKEINFRAAFRWLRKKWHIQRLLCEGGGELHDAIIRAGLLDELHLTISPTIFGGRTAPTLADGVGFARLADAAKLELKSARRVGDEMFLILTSQRF